MKDYLHKLLVVVCLCFSSTSFIQSQNNSLNFDGNNDYVYGGTLKLPQSYTKEAWIYITALENHNNIISGGGVGTSHAFWASTANSNKLSAGHNGLYTQVIDDQPLLANTWYHVAVTFDGISTMKLYKNGVLISGINQITGANGTNTSVGPISNDNNVYIGSFGVGFYLAGNMSNVRIWNVARTEAEIAANMNVTFTTTQTNLIANYTCKQGIGGGDNTAITQLLDVPSGTNNGTLVNFALMGSTSNFIGLSLVLPVELLSFKAIPLASALGSSSSNLLTWQTANELNNKGFQVERLKALGTDWEILGFVAAKGKYANYEFTDNTPLSMSYYRLREIDYDGKEVLSNVVSLALKGSKGLKVYPSIVANGFLSVEVITANEMPERPDYGIFNLLGQQVLKGQVTQQIDVSALPIGTYVIKVGTEQAKFIKQ